MLDSTKTPEWLISPVGVGIAWAHGLHMVIVGRLLVHFIIWNHCPLVATEVFHCIQMTHEMSIQTSHIGWLML